MQELKYLKDKKMIRREEAFITDIIYPMKKEFDALYLLLMNRKRVMTFETIAYQVWGMKYIDVTPQAIHNLMSRLHQKLQIRPDIPEYIVSVRGVGYKYEAKI